MKKRIIIATVLCLCIVFVLLVAGVFSGGNKTVLKSENYEISQRILDCYIDIEKNGYVEEYKKDYGDYFLKAAGLDPEKSLKKQESCYGGTWYDYFKNSAMQKLNEKLLYCEAAREKGITPDKKRLEEVGKKTRASLENVKESDLRIISELEVLSQAYLSEFTAANTPTKEEKTEYYEKNKRLFDCVDYNRIIINIADGAKIEERGVTELTAEIADSIKTAGFEETLKLYNITDQSDLFEIKYEEGYAYEDSTQFGNWAFSVERKDKDVTCFSGTGVESVYFLKRASYPADYTIRRIQKITLNADAIKDSLDDLYEIANNLAGEKNTAENLLLYADKAGFFVEETDALKENLSISVKNWLYDASRKIGDNSILEDGYSVSFIRYCEDGEQFFENRLTAAVVGLKTEEHLKQLKKEIKISGQ